MNPIGACGFTQLNDSSFTPNGRESAVVMEYNQPENIFEVGLRPNYATVERFFVLLPTNQNFSDCLTLSGQ